MSRVRVGLLSPVLAFGGAERWMLDLMRHTDPERIEWAGTALLRKFNGQPETIREFERLAPVYYASAGVAELARRCDVLISWGIPNVRAFVPNTYSGRLILVSHGSGPWTARVFAKAHGQELVAVSPSALDPIPERWRDRVTIIRNGVDPERLRPRHCPSWQRKRWRIPPAAPILGYLGRLSREKNPLTWIRTLAQLPGWHGVICGVGSDEGEIRALAAELGCADRLLLPGFTADVGTALRTFSSLLMPAHEEGYGLALAEAMLCRCPVVSTPVGIVPECPDCVEVVPLRPAPGECATAVLEAFLGKRVNQAYAWACKHSSIGRFGREWTEFLAL